MEAIDSSVYMETVVSPTTPKDGIELHVGIYI